jgi:hypothetical protein
MPVLSRIELLTDAENSDKAATGAKPSLDARRDARALQSSLSRFLSVISASTSAKRSSDKHKLHGPHLSNFNYDNQ